MCWEKPLFPLFCPISSGTPGSLNFKLESFLHPIRVLGGADSQQYPEDLGTSSLAQGKAKANLSRVLMVLKQLFLGGSKRREVLHKGAGLCDWDGKVW